MILIDHQIFQNQIYGGISRIFIELFKNLPTNYEIANCIHKNQYLRKLRFRGYIGRVSAFFQNKLISLNEKMVIDQFCGGGYSLVHATYYDCDYLIEAKIPYTVHVYDLIAYKHGNDHFRKLFARAVLNSIGVVCISDYTKKELLAQFPIKNKHVAVVHLASGLGDFNNNQNNISSEISEQITIGYTGVRSDHKNFKVLIELAQVSVFKDRLRIYCFGGGRFTKSERKIFNQARVQVKRFRGSDKNLKVFYQNIDVFIYPSLEEGFGIPPLEAMSQGVPVIASNRSSIPEVCGNGALYFEPQDARSLISALQRLEVSEYRSEMINRGYAQNKFYTWHKTCDAQQVFHREILASL